MNTRILCLIVVGLLLGFRGQSAPVYVNSPRPAGPVDQFLPGPFFLDRNQSVRLQQVYEASDFSGYGFPEEGVLITEISFFGGPVPIGLTTPSNIQINLSTTSKLPDGLSASFAENIGSDDLIVYGPSPLRITQGPGATMGITLSQPFPYRSSSGNLLLDIRNWQGMGQPPPPSSWQLAVVSRAGDSVSGVSSSDVNSAIAEFGDTFGLMTVFTVIPIPEPGPVVLLAVGGVALFLFTSRGRLRFRRRDVSLTQP
ncbi:MAG: hypothetical protein HZA90_21860 [Verrucomicrobia bacterium]|nr:hypothetical protein [Verrucomicrobiota bacterium]